MSSIVSVDQYVQQQRRRLADLRAATEKERQLLHTQQQQHATRPAAASSGPPLLSTTLLAAAPVAPGDGAASAGVRTNLHYSQTPPHASGSRSASTASMPAVQHTTWQPRSTDLGDMHFTPAAAQLASVEQQVARVRLEALARELDAEEADLRDEERRLDAAIESNHRQTTELEERRKVLVQRLAAANGDESECHEAEADVSVRETRLREAMDTWRDQQREAAHQARLVSAEYAERRGTLEAAERRAQAKAADDGLMLQRLRAQVEEAEDRARAVDLQVTLKSRGLDDLERAVARRDMEMRDEQLRAIEQLKRDLALREFGSGGMTVPTA